VHALTSPGGWFRGGRERVQDNVLEGGFKMEGDEREKRERRFIKNDMTGNIEVTGRKMKTFVATMGGTIVKEDAFVGLISQFVLVVGAQVWPTCTSENT
jgi:hypothetical protein